MALPPSVVERLGRKGPEDSPAFFGQLMFFAVAILAVSLILYAGLRFGYEPFIKGRIANLDESIAKEEKNITSENKAKILAISSSLNNLQDILKKSKSAADYVAWLQQKTLTSVRYKKLDFNRDTGVMSLTGVARTMEDFTAQIKAFQQDSLTKQASFGHLRPAPGGGWEFDLTIQLTSDTKK